VSYLQENKVQEHKEGDEVKELFEWAKHKKVPAKNLDTLLHIKSKWRTKSDKLKQQNIEQINTYTYLIETII
jgi:hypothetical protein